MSEEKPSKYNQTSVKSDSFSNYPILLICFSLFVFENSTIESTREAVTSTLRGEGREGWDTPTTPAIP